MKEINCEELQEKLDIASPSFKLINALEPSKYERKHITGSVNYSNHEEIKTDVRLNEDVVLYCSDKCCKRSIALYHHMMHWGYKHVARYPGGLLEWEEKGLPLSGTEVDQNIVIN